MDPASDPSVSRAGPYDRDGLHSGIGGLAHVLAEIRLARPWTAEESDLADGRRRPAPGPDPRVTTDVTLFDGLVEHRRGADRPGARRARTTAVDRLAALAGDRRLAARRALRPAALPPRAPASTTPRSGTAGRPARRALGAAARGVPGARALAEHAAATCSWPRPSTAPTGTNWRLVPAALPAPSPATGRCRTGRTASPASPAALAAGRHRAGPPGPGRGRAPRRRAPRHARGRAPTAGSSSRCPSRRDPATVDPVTYTWCHGPTGTSLLFPALDRAGVADVAGEPAADWHRAVPAQRADLRPPGAAPPRLLGQRRPLLRYGGRRRRVPRRLAADRRRRTTWPSRCTSRTPSSSGRCATAPHAYWRFVEHRADEPLLPPGVGWMQGAAGIAAYLFRCARVVEDGSSAAPVPRADTWWAVLA